MKDRRPSKPKPVKVNEVEELWVTTNYSMRPPTPADLIAAVRREVESGTIKGEVVERMCVEHRSWLRDGDPSSVCAIYSWVRQYQGTPTRCKIVERLIVGPVSDGGSET